MGKKFKVKKRFKLKYISNTFVILVLILLINYLLKNIDLTIESSNTGFINKILSNISNDNTLNKIENISSYISSDLFNSPKHILDIGLNDIKLENTNNITLMYKENDMPLVYIYNSHQGENYDVKYLEEYNIVPNVVIASNMLKEKLENIGIKTLVEENDILEYMNQNGLNHSGSYIASRYFLNQIVNKYSSIKLFIDLHRDSASYNATTTTIDNKSCAKVLFVIGLENPSYQMNLNVTEQINTLISSNFPNLTRGILKKEGTGVNGVYNQDLDSNIILMELGGFENNIDEINNTLDIIANVIKEYVDENK